MLHYYSPYKNYSQDNTIQKLINSVKLSGLSKSISLIEKLVNSDKILFKDYRDSYIIPNSEQKEAYIIAIKEIIQSLDITHGDNWDFDWIYKIDKICLIPVIHFPKYTIQNSGGTSRQLKDTFIGIEFTFKSYDDENNEFRYKYYPERPCGFRTTLKSDEATNGYIHSHLPPSRGSTDLVFNRFCIGNAELEQLGMEMQTLEEADPPTLMLYLISLKTLLEWESLEGVPHKYIDKIVQNNNSIRYNNVLFQTAYRYIRENDIKYDFFIDENVYKVRYNKRLHDSIKQKFIDSDDAELQRILVKEERHTYSSYENIISKTNKKVLNNYYIFNGKKYYMTIEPIRQGIEGQHINEFIVYPKFINDVIQKVQSRLFETRLKNYIS